MRAQAQLGPTLHSRLKPSKHFIAPKHALAYKYSTVKILTPLTLCLLFAFFHININTAVDGIPHWGPTSILLCFSLALMLALSAPRIAKKLAPKSLYLAITFLLCAFLIHFRYGLYFYWDEWWLLGRLAEGGSKATLIAHNEHFLPAFFYFYFLENKIFGDSYSSYLLISLCFHVVNSLLLKKCLQKIFQIDSAPASFLAFMFLLSSLHSEPLELAIEQSLIISSTCILLTFFLIFDFIETNRFQSLISIFFLSLINPLFFGNGFCLLPLCILFILWRALYQSPKKKPLSIKRALLSLASSALGLTIAVVFYLAFQVGEGHGVADAKPFGNLKALIDYLLVGTQIGSVLRGLGLSFSLAQPIPQWNFSLPLLGDLSLRNSLLSFGICASLMTLVFSLGLYTNKRNALLNWLLGQGFIFTTLMLPALGRWNFGESQSLSLRYHYLALVGVMILIVPIATSFFDILKKEKTKRSPQERAVFSLGKLALVVYFFSHLSLITVHNEFSHKSAKNKAYILELKKWRTKLARENIDPVTNFEARGTSFENGFPILPEYLTPGRHPNQLYQVLKYLNPEKYRD